jgi:hypothetical protein
MNELFELLRDSKTSLTGGEHDGQTIGVIKDITDPTDKDPIRTSFTVKPEDQGIGSRDFVRMFARPAVLSITRARQREKIEAIRKQAEEIHEACAADEDLNVYEKGLEQVLTSFEAFFGPVERE